MGTVKDSEVTKAKIIKAAGKLFAQRGLKGVTVRTIAEDADTHLSALNYHFRSKEALYFDTLFEACEVSSITEKEQKQLLSLKPEKALYILVKETLKEYGKQSDDNWHIPLITRECWEPSEAFDKVAEKYFKPEADFIAGLIGAIVGKDQDDRDVRFAVISLIGLLETFGLYEHLVDALAPGFSEGMNKRDYLATMIVNMVVGGATSS